MTNFVYPALPGLTFNNKRTPVWRTGVHASLSRKESRLAYQQYPQFEFELQYEFLRDAISPSELKSIVGLYMACAGQYDTFLFSDPAFNSVTAQQFGLGDGTTAAFQIIATYENSGGPGIAEIIQNFNGTPAIYINGALDSTSNYTLGATGIVTFTTAPASGAVITWSGGFYYRCRFSEDTLSFTQFMNQLWKVGKVAFQSVKL